MPNTVLVTGAGGWLGGLVSDAYSILLQISAF